MKADRDNGSQKIFTPWCLDQYGTTSTDNRDVTEENRHGRQGNDGLHKFESNNDIKHVFSPWEQEKYNYLSVKRNLLSGSEGCLDYCGKQSLCNETSSCDRLLNDSVSGKIDLGNQQENGETETSSQNGTSVIDTDTKTGDRSCESKRVSNAKETDSLRQSKMELKNTETRANKSCQNKIVSKNHNLRDTQHLSARPRSRDQCHKDFSLNSASVSSLWNYKSINDNVLYTSASLGCEPDKITRHRNPSSTDICSRKSRKRSVDSSDSNIENKENFTSHSPGRDSDNKSPRTSLYTSDDTYEPMNKLCKVSNVLHNSMENLMQYAEVLYKCKLCTTLPSILTSRDSFLSHVSEEHLPNNDQLKECGRCCLRFGTVEDLRTHISSEHKNVYDDKQQDKINKKCPKILNRAQPGFRARDNFKGQKRSPSFLRSDSDDLESGSQKLVEDITVAEDQETTSHPPKLVITHGVERSVHLAPTQNISHLQKLTDQIIASNKQEKDGCQRLSPNTNPIIMTPCYTAEFGQFTKLVREGGNIVYFCQLCNWKSQVKMQFQTHCSGSHHINKVKAADQTDPDESATPLSLDSKGQKSEKKSTDYKEPVGWTPRGHMSFLTETSGFHMGNSLSKTDKEYGGFKDKASNSRSHEENMKTEMKFMDKTKDANVDEKLEKNMEVEKEHRRNDKEGRTENKDNKANQYEKEEMVKVKQNKRKRAAPVVLRNQADCEEGWGSDEYDDCDSDISTGSPHRQHRSGSGGKRRLLGKTRSPEDRGQFQRSSRQEKDQSLSVKDRLYPSGGWEGEDESWSPQMGEQSIAHSRSPIPTASASRPTPPPVVNMYPNHTPPVKLTSSGLQEEEMEKTASMIRHYFESQLGFRGLDRPIKYPSAADWPIPPQTSNRNGEQSSSAKGSGYCPRETPYMYNCSLCDFGCADMSEYRLHFDTEHGQATDLETGDAASDGRGESWKMWKIKEILPDLICVFPRGNVSRDLLLQKISIILNLPEATQWGPACNKAVREQFPHSLAQRKGKYKKTFFFGVALNEHVQEQEEVSDGEGVTYQPLRDMSQDMEKILGHLHSLVQWTGDLDSGVSRDEILELLKGRIEEPDVQHWGVQCNRAIRVLFPNVEMKRKGKYKTTVFFGVDFRQDIHKQAFLPNKRGRPRKFPFFDQAQQMDQQSSLTWLEALRSSHEELYPQEGTSEGHGSRSERSSATITRGWGPSLGNKDFDKDKTSGDEGEWPSIDKFGQFSPFLRYRKQDERSGLDLSLGDKNARSSPGTKQDSFLKLGEQSSPWHVPPGLDNLHGSRGFGGELRDGLIRSLLQPLPPSSLQPCHFDPALLYRLRAWQRSASDDGEEPIEDEEENDAADGDDEDSNASKSSLAENKSQKHEKSQKLKHRSVGKKLEKTNHTKNVSTSPQFKLSDNSCVHDNTEQLQCKGDNLVPKSQVHEKSSHDQENEKDKENIKEQSSGEQDETKTNLQSTDGDFGATTEGSSSFDTTDERSSRQKTRGDAEQV
ncbi:uncharacterized protein [Argopecten irradians]|uniref:uncharacterized protein n=1 Tax=Argopecten irradians TaxID=31199 RepID=UPI0037245BAE